MPLTVITLKNAVPSLRGDLSKWMQEIATGVYIGNFNSRVREQLWDRVRESVGVGEATLSYASRNEIGYQFETLNTQRQSIDFDGIPLVLLWDVNKNQEDSQINKNYSNAASYRKAKLKSSSAGNKRDTQTPFVVLDIETDGLDEKKNTIIEIGAIKIEGDQTTEFHRLVKYDKILPEEIVALTGIENELLDVEGKRMEEVLIDLRNFIQEYDIVGYGIDFDLRFINNELKLQGMQPLENKMHDILIYAKKEKMFLKNYKLETVLQSYVINEQVPHRALLDARLIYRLAMKVNKFVQILNHK